MSSILDKEYWDEYEAFEDEMYSLATSAVSMVNNSELMTTTTSNLIVAPDDSSNPYYIFSGFGAFALMLVFLICQKIYRRCGNRYDVEQPHLIDFSPPKPSEPETIEFSFPPPPPQPKTDVTNCDGNDPMN